MHDNFINETTIFIESCIDFANYFALKQLNLFWLYYYNFLHGLQYLILLLLIKFQILLLKEKLITDQKNRLKYKMKRKKKEI